MNPINSGPTDPSLTSETFVSSNQMYAFVEDGVVYIRAVWLPMKRSEISELGF